MSPSRNQLAEIIARAQSRCEYCRMHHALQGATFHVEHILPRSRGGNSELANLAWACPSCNLNKSDHIAAIDPDSRLTAPLFNPRSDAWSEHFTWQEFCIVGRTPTGRATVLLLNLNHPRRILIRKVEARFALFPPE